MNIDIKRHIDAARQVLVGVVPNPTSQIEQITYALIYKFMDDMDQLAIKHGDEPAFFVGELERYSWARIMDTKVGNQERMNLYIEGFEKISNSETIPPLFRNILKQAFLPHRSPEVLGLFLKEINYFDYSHPEELGNAYEYLLQVMGSQGDAGQFRTPRHVIDFIVAAVNPTKDDKVLDPACGTAGFLISAYKHILAQHDGKNNDGTPNDEKKLNPDDRKKIAKNFEGYDIDPGMVRIAQVNMYLHQFKSPKIFQYDSLSMEERWNDKFDVILANPPFMSPKGGIRPHSKFSIMSTRSEVLFTDYIMSHLRPKGRAGFIVPEGVIFQSGTAYKQLRKNLVEDGLYAVVSLPSGVFNPYAGVKTSILLFDNELAKQRKELLFIKIEKEGYDLGAQRRPLCSENGEKPERCPKHSDFPLALEVLNKWKKNEKIEDKHVLYIEKEAIAKNGNYNLSEDSYRIKNDYTNVKWPMVSLEDVCDKITDGTHNSPIYVSTGIPMLDAKDINNGIIDEKNSMKFISQATDNELSKRCKPKAGDVLVSSRGSIGKLALVKPGQNFNMMGNIILLRPSAKIVPKFLLSLLSYINLETQAHGVAQKGLYLGKIKTIKVPLPPLEIQEQIVEEINGYQKIIDGAKQIVQNWKPKIDVDPEWEEVKIGEVCEVFGGGTPSRMEKKYWGGSIHWISSKYFSDDHTIKGSEMITEDGLKNSSSKIAPKGSTILITRVSVGKFAIADQDYAVNQDLTVLVSKSDKLDSKYLWLVSDKIADKVKTNAVGIGVKGVTRDFVTNQVVALPPLGIQKEIVEKVKIERELVEATKRLIDIYTEKTNKKIGELWGDSKA